MAILAFIKLQKMQRYQSYIQGKWFDGQGVETNLYNAITGEHFGETSSAGIDYEAVLRYGRITGGEKLRKMTFQERGRMLKALAFHLLEKKNKYYQVSALSGATKVDSWIDIAGVLDWELATVGDPLMDLGSSLAYWVDRDDEPAFASLRRQPSHLPGMPTREQFVARYLELSGRSCADFTFYEVFGLFRLAVIIQQIWARYRAGQTTNPAFAGFGDAVNTLINRAEGKIA